jgi:hypothetical protein
MCYKINEIGLKFERQKGISVIYNHIKIELGFRVDNIVENKVIT